MSPTRLLAALMIGGALLSTPALAAPDDDARTAVVRTDDLNLASSSGVATLHRRLMRAVTSVCGVADVSLATQKQIGACRQTAFRAAGHQVEIALAAARNAPMLAAMDTKKPASGL